jgi:hypothetical protein
MYDYGKKMLKLLEPTYTTPPVEILKKLLLKFKERGTGCLSMFKTPRHHETLCDQLLAIANTPRCTLSKLLDPINQYKNTLSATDELTQLFHAFLFRFPRVIHLISNRDLLSLFQKKFSWFSKTPFYASTLFVSDLSDSKNTTVTTILQKLSLKIETDFIQHDEISSETCQEFIIHLKHFRQSTRETIIHYLFQNIKRPYKINLDLLSKMKDIINYMSEEQKLFLREIIVTTIHKEKTAGRYYHSRIDLRPTKTTNDIYLILLELLKLSPTHQQDKVIHELIQLWKEDVPSTSYDIKPVQHLFLYICTLELSAQTSTFLFEIHCSILKHFTYPTALIEQCLLALGNSIPPNLEDRYLASILSVNRNLSYSTYSKQLLTLVSRSTSLKSHALKWLQSVTGFDNDSSWLSETDILMKYNFHELYVYIAFMHPDLHSHIYTKINSCYEKREPSTGAHYLVTLLLRVIHAIPNNSKLNDIVLTMLQNNPWPCLDISEHEINKTKYGWDESAEKLQSFPEDIQNTLKTLLNTLTFEKKKNFILKLFSEPFYTTWHESFNPTNINFAIISVASLIQSVEEFDVLFESTHTLINAQDGKQNRPVSTAASIDKKPETPVINKNHVCERIALISGMCDALATLNITQSNNSKSCIPAAIDQLIDLFPSAFSIPYRCNIEYTHVQALNATANAFVLASPKQQQKLMMFIINCLTSIIIPHDPLGTQTKRWGHDFIRTHALNALLKIATMLTTQRLIELIDLVETHASPATQHPTTAPTAAIENSSLPLNPDVLPQLHNLLLEKIRVERSLKKEAGLIPELQHLVWQYRG